jgi:hypothetical protein
LDRQQRLNLRVAKKSTDHGKAHALTDSEGGKTVPEVMDADIFNPSHLPKSPPWFLNVVQVAAFF